MRTFEVKNDIHINYMKQYGAGYESTMFNIDGATSKPNLVIF